MRSSALFARGLPCLLWVDGTAHSHRPAKAIGESCRQSADVSPQRLASPLLSLSLAESIGIGIGVGTSLGLSVL